GRREPDPGKRVGKGKGAGAGAAGRKWERMRHWRWLGCAERAVYAKAAEAGVGVDPDFDVAGADVEPVEIMGRRVAGPKGSPVGVQIQHLPIALVADAVGPHDGPAARRADLLDVFLIGDENPASAITRRKDPNRKKLAIIATGNGRQINVNRQLASHGRKPENLPAFGRVEDC